MLSKSKHFSLKFSVNYQIWDNTNTKENISKQRVTWVSLSPRNDTEKLTFVNCCLKVRDTLERLQALFTMHELLVTLADTPVVKHIVVEPDPKISASDIEHVIKIKYSLDDSIIKKIEPIVTKRNLKIQKLDNVVVIQ
jgi:hypothetical protein